MKGKKSCNSHVIGHVMTPHGWKLTFGERFLCVWFASNERDEGIVAVVNLILKLQLRSLDVAGVNKLVASDLTTHRLLQRQTEVGVMAGNSIITSSTKHCNHQYEIKYYQICLDTVVFSHNLALFPKWTSR